MKFPKRRGSPGVLPRKLREKLKDPAFRKIEGFPIGEDEDILALSDPPYYTACPNPFLGRFHPAIWKGSMTRRLTNIEGSHLRRT